MEQLTHDLNQSGIPRNGTGSAQQTHIVPDRRSRQMDCVAADLGAACGLPQGSLSEGYKMCASGKWHQHTCAG